MNFLDDLSYPNLYMSNLCCVGRLSEMGTLYSIFHLTRQSKEGSGFKTKHEKKERKAEGRTEIFFLTIMENTHIENTSYMVHFNICG